MLLYITQHDLTLQKYDFEKKLRAVQPGFHTPTIHVDYRWGEKSFTVHTDPNFSAVPILQEIRSKRPDFSKEPEQQWAAAESAVKRLGKPVVVIFAPYSRELPYAHFATYEWIMGLRYGVQKEGLSR